MAATEAARDKLYNRLTEVIGADNADTLMRSLPPIPASDLATKKGVAVVGEDVAALREEFTDLRREFRDLRGEFKELRHEVRAEISGLRDDVKGEIKAVNQRLDLGLAALNQRFDKAFIAQIATLVTVVAAIFASNAFL